MADDPKSRGGFTVSELEGKVKKYGLEICLCAIFILTAIFTLVWGGMILLWSILLSMIFGIVGVLAPKPMDKILHSALQFAYKEKVTGIVVAVAGLLVSILLPPIVFAIVGLVAGKSLAMCASCPDEK